MWMIDFGKCIRQQLFVVFSKKKIYDKTTVMWSMKQSKKFWNLKISFDQTSSSFLYHKKSRIFISKPYTVGRRKPIFTPRAFNRQSTIARFARGNLKGKMNCCLLCGYIKIFQVPNRFLRNDLENLPNEVSVPVALSGPKWWGINCD